MSSESKSKSRKASFKIGTKVVNLHKSLLSGFLHMKAYTVVGTSRSKAVDHLGNACKAGEFLVKDEDGLLRRQRLDKTFLQHWEVINV